MNKTKMKVPPLAAALTIFASLAGGVMAQTFEWADYNGFAADFNARSGTSPNYTFAQDTAFTGFSLAGATGSVTVEHTGWGSYHLTDQTQATASSGTYAGQAYQSAYANSLGGVDGTTQLTLRPFDAGSGSIQYAQTVWTYQFDNGYTSPESTIITLSDPGAFWATAHLATYQFEAYLNGVKQDISSWEFRNEDVYGILANYTPGAAPYDWTPSYVWDGSTGTYTVNYPVSSQIPTTVTYFDTNGVVFDKLVMTANGAANDVYGFNLGTVVPEPSSALLVVFSSCLFLKRRR